jgi:hypothetical protein
MKSGKVQGHLSDENSSRRLSLQIDEMDSDRPKLTAQQKLAFARAFKFHKKSSGSKMSDSAKVTLTLKFKKLRNSTFLKLPLIIEVDSEKLSQFIMLLKENFYFIFNVVERLKQLTFFTITFLKLFYLPSVTRLGNFLPIGPLLRLFMFF